MADSAVSPIPEGYHSLTPSITVRGAAEAIEWYKRAFGAVEISRAVAPDGVHLWHAELQIGDSRMMLTDEMPEMGSHGPASTGAVGFSIWLYVPDVDAVYQRAVEAGATVGMPVNDTFWGDRFGGLRDPYGHNWAIATRKENLDEEEVRRRADEFTASMSGSRPAS
jgi:PhnB protein